jgi:peptidoglycan/xylan/chitin deacetylase (PgdA/CDA1 family)
MQLIKQNVIPFFGHIINLKRLIRYTNQNIIHIFGHTVTDEYLPHINPIYKPKSVLEFKKDLEYILKYFEPVSVQEVLSHTNKEKIITKPSFHLSFDDGLKEIYDVVLPILKSKGIPATVFINSDFVDNKDLFFRYKAALIANRIPNEKERVLAINYSEKNMLDEMASQLNLNFIDFLNTQKPYLTSEQLKTLQKNGFTIGGHSQNHPNYNLLSEFEQVSQTINSCKFVQNEFLEKNSFFAFPFTSEGIPLSFYGKIAKDISLTFGVSGLDFSNQGKHIERIDIENYGRNAREYIHRAYMTNLLKKITRTIKNRI